MTAYQFQDGDSGVELLDDILELSTDEEILINSDVLDNLELNIGTNLPLVGAKNPPFFFFFLNFC